MRTFEREAWPVLDHSLKEKAAISEHAWSPPFTAYVLGTAVATRPNGWLSSVSFGSHLCMPNRHPSRFSITVPYRPPNVLRCAPQSLSTAEHWQRTLIGRSGKRVRGARPIGHTQYERLSGVHLARVAQRAGAAPARSATRSVTTCR